jgi:hypothetical protein
MEKHFQSNNFTLHLLLVYLIYIAMKDLITQQLLKHFLLLMLMFVSIYPAVAQGLPEEQQDYKPKWNERLFYGGGLGLQFGNMTLVDISPMIGYKLTPRIGVGLNPTYKYYAYRNYYGTDADLKSNVFGCGVFGRVLILDNIFAHAEYEYLYFKTKETYTQTKKYSTEYQSVLIGAGYRQAVAQNAFMYLLVLWNINETIDSPYNNPVIRAGFSIGF